MQDDKVNITPQGSEQDSKIVRRGSKDWVPHEAKMLFASLIQQVNQDQWEQSRTKQDGPYGLWEDIPLVAREFHRQVGEEASPVGETASYEVTAVGDDGAVSFREKVRPDVEEWDSYGYENMTML